MEKQVDKSLYNWNNYVGLGRWCSYWHQINEVIRTTPESLLIIGAGDSIVKNVLTNYVPHISTLDIDPELNPDYVGSVSELGNICSDKFDTILCCQVLEHLPFQLFESCISQLKESCEKYCIISLPQIYTYHQIALKIGGHGRDYKTVQLLNGVDFSFDGQHYWEIGAKGCSLSDVKEILKNFFRISYDYTVAENPYHHFFILTK